MVERAPRMVEYICLACGAQGLVQVEPIETRDRNGEVSLLLKCPKCAAGAFCFDRGPATVLVNVHAQIN